MLKAVLFDLDGTLLDIELGSFLEDYFAMLGPALAELTGLDSSRVLDAVMKSTSAMCGHHPGRVNRDVFNSSFAHLTGVDPAREDVAAALERFYRDSFPSLHGTCSPHIGTRRVVSVAHELGLRTAVATNPIFPLAAVEERMRWAELQPSEFDAITSYETSTACKPAPTYYRDLCETLHVTTAECLMVGDDPVLDLAAADVGMKTFYVGVGPATGSDWAGSLEDLAELLPRLVD